MQYAIEHKLWNGKGDLDFATCFSDGVLDCNTQGSRLLCGAALMKKYEENESTSGGGGSLDAEAMMEILRNHGGGICMHGGFETTAAMVSELKRNESGKLEGEDRESKVRARHWMTGKPHPCRSPFLLLEFVEGQSETKY